MKRSEVEFEMMLEKRRNDSQFQNMTNEELFNLQLEIATEVERRRDKEASEVKEEFLRIWEKMKELGFKITADCNYQFLTDIDIELNCEKHVKHINIVDRRY